MSNKGYSSIEDYIKITNGLLSKYFGIHLSDSSFDEEVVLDYFKRNVEAWELVNDIAEDAELDRIDTVWMPQSRILSTDESEFVSEHKRRSP